MARAKAEKQIESPKKTHSDLSPSNAYRWWSCPGSVALCRLAPETPESPYAAEGTAAHEVLDRCLKHYFVEKYFLNPFDMVGMEVKGFEVTEEMAEAVSVAIDYVKAEMQKGGDLKVDMKVDVLLEDGVPIIRGTLDVAIIRHFEEIVNIDFKYGKGVLVRAEDNHQLIQYTLPLAKMYTAETMKLVIIQPRVMTEDKISSWNVTPEYMATYYQEMIRHVELTKEKNASLNPGDWCKFCKAKAQCPALRKDLATSLAPIKGSEVVFPDVKALTIDNVVKILDYKDRIEEWLDAVAAYAHSVVEAGGVVPGYELAKKRANRRWTDEKKVAEAFLGEFGNDIFDMKIKSPAQLEKIVGKERVAELTEVPDNGLTLKKTKK